MSPLATAMLQTSWGFATLPNGLRLDYSGTSFSPDQPVYVLQFKSPDTSRLVEIPFGQNTANSRFNTIISIRPVPKNQTKPISML